MMGEHISVARIIEAKDFIYALALGVFSLLLLPESELSINAQKEIYGMAISVLSILFGLFFAAFGIIVSVPNQDFIDFANKKKSISNIIGGFEWTLVMLFVALIYSIVIWAYTQIALNSSLLEAPSICLFSLFVFLFSYSLFSAFISALDCTRMVYKYLDYLYILDRKKQTTSTK